MKFEGWDGWGWVRLGACISRLDGGEGRMHEIIRGGWVRLGGEVLMQLVWLGQIV